jgi:hypothetical protein
VQNICERNILKDQKEDGSIILRRKVVRMGGGWNWLRIVSNGRLFLPLQSLGVL